MPCLLSHIAVVKTGTSDKPPVSLFHYSYTHIHHIFIHTLTLQPLPTHTICTHTIYTHTLTLKTQYSCSPFDCVGFFQVLLFAHTYPNDLPLIRCGKWALVKVSGSESVNKSQEEQATGKEMRGCFCFRCCQRFNGLNGLLCVIRNKETQV